MKKLFFCSLLFLITTIQTYSQCIRQEFNIGYNFMHYGDSASLFIPKGAKTIDLHLSTRTNIYSSSQIEVVLKTCDGTIIESTGFFDLKSSHGVAFSVPDSIQSGYCKIVTNGKNLYYNSTQNQFVVTFLNEDNKKVNFITMPLEHSIIYGDTLNLDFKSYYSSSRRTFDFQTEFVGEDLGILNIDGTSVTSTNIPGAQAVKVKCFPGSGAEDYAYTDTTIYITNIVDESKRKTGIIYGNNEYLLIDKVASFNLNQVSNNKETEISYEILTDGETITIEDGIIYFEDTTQNIVVNIKAYQAESEEFTAVEKFMRIVYTDLGNNYLYPLVVEEELIDSILVDNPNALEETSSTEKIRFENILKDGRMNEIWYYNCVRRISLENANASTHTDKLHRFTRLKTLKYTNYHDVTLPQMLLDNTTYHLDQLSLENVQSIQYQHSDDFRNNISELTITRSKNILDIPEFINKESLIRFELLSEHELEFSMFAGCYNLKYLLLKNNNFKNLEGIEKLSNLEYIDVLNNKINDISGIEELKKINHINLSNNFLSYVEFDKLLSPLPITNYLFPQHKLPLTTTIEGDTIIVEYPYHTENNIYSINNADRLEGNKAFFNIYYFEGAIVNFEIRNALYENAGYYYKEITEPRFKYLFSHEVFLSANSIKGIISDFKDYDPDKAYLKFDHDDTRYRINYDHDEQYYYVYFSKELIDRPFRFYNKEGSYELDKKNNPVKHRVGKIENNIVYIDSPLFFEELNGADKFYTPMDGWNYGEVKFFYHNILERKDTVKWVVDSYDIDLNPHIRCVIVYDSTDVQLGVLEPIIIDDSNYQNFHYEYILEPNEKIYFEVYFTEFQFSNYKEYQIASSFQTDEFTTGIFDYKKIVTDKGLKIDEAKVNYDYYVKNDPRGYLFIERAMEYRVSLYNYGNEDYFGFYGLYEDVEAKKGKDAFSLDTYNFFYNLDIVGKTYDASSSIYRTNGEINLDIDNYSGISKHWSGGGYITPTSKGWGHIQLSHQGDENFQPFSERISFNVGGPESIEEDKPEKPGTDIEGDIITSDINDIGKIQLFFYQNTLFVKLNSIKELHEYSIININGSIIQNTQVEQKGDEFELKIPALQKGVYIIKLFLENKVYTYKYMEE
ncbi:leucine-rich repeat domain-containing protein [Flammeovirga aprica]|uniref:Leucine-rich repeat domain-containing protein n=1 Tax=Flammeovirga aprica JL-4 TaxID=694437 RepID=A0A7X9RU01_9BACT|nr:leucine-rich repeat domain-containing protein [Flammeovirga aprica]NME68404.1 leucine-rich repeat domain-containing protein [Flammeovirga aprica JL-4]